MVILLFFDSCQSESDRFETTYINRQITKKDERNKF